MMLVIYLAADKSLLPKGHKAVCIAAVEGLHAVSMSVCKVLIAVNSPVDMCCAGVQSI